MSDDDLKTKYDLLSQNDISLMRPKEINDLLRVYMDGLNTCYNVIIERPQTNKIQNDNNLRVCNEKAKIFLKNAQQLIKFIENSSIFSIEDLNEENILAMINKIHENRQNFINKLSNIHEKYQINLNLMSKKIKNVSDFLGLDILKMHLTSYLKSQIKSHAIYNSKDDSIKNTLVYGPSGSGKVSLIFTLLNNHMNLNSKVLIDSKEKKLKIFLLDFETILAENDKTILQSIFKSIDLFNRKTEPVLIILLNLESLFAACEENSLKLHLIGDLLNRMSHHQVSRNDDLFSTAYEQVYSIQFIAVSKSPWLLHTAILYRFDTKIYCGNLTKEEQETMIKILMNHNLKKLKQEWLMSESELVLLSEEFIYSLINMIQVCCPKILGQIDSFIVKKFKILVRDRFIKKLFENDLKEEDFSKSEAALNRSQEQLMMMSNSGLKDLEWKNATNKILMAKTFLKFSQSNKNEDKPKFDSEISEIDRHSNMAFNSIRSIVWNEVYDLRNSLLKSIQEFIEQNCLLSKNFLEKFQAFQKEFQF